jgi:hypothetical protein
MDRVLADPSALRALAESTGRTAASVMAAGERLLAAFAAASEELASSPALTDDVLELVEHTRGVTPSLLGLADRVLRLAGILEEYLDTDGGTASVPFALAPAPAAAVGGADPDRRVRLEQLKGEGHGPQRHEGDPTPEQVRARLGRIVRDGEGNAVVKTNGYLKNHRCIDPQSGTEWDQHTVGKKHLCPRLATRISSAKDYCDAEDQMRRRAEAERASRPEELRFGIFASLLEVLGPDFADKCEGWYLVDVGGNDGYAEARIDESWVMAAVYDNTPDGLRLRTMYPDEGSAA